jgi:uncharacterized membrane protein
MPFTIGPAELIVVLIDAALIAVPVLLVVVIARAVASGSAARSAPEPRVVFAARLARGEISRAEFDTAIRALGPVE